MNSKFKFSSLVFILLFFVACSGPGGGGVIGPQGGGQAPAPVPPPVPVPAPGPAAPAAPQNNPVPYFDSLLSPEQVSGQSEKYRLIFTNESLLQALSPAREGPFPQWSDDLKRTFLEMILFYEEHHGESLPPFSGSCSFEDEERPCYTMQDLPRPHLALDPDYARYVELTQMAWHLYVEANHLVPWSILNYSADNLAILFGSSFTQPRVGAQYYVANFNIIEDYRLIRGLLREAGDSGEDLLGPTALKTVLNTSRFVGEHLTHVRGTSNNNMGPSFSIWPYRARDAQGNILRDALGHNLPLPRHPTSREILIYRDPHRNLDGDPQRAGGVEVYPELGAQYHIINGCWGSSAVLKALLGSVNLPVELMGDYFSFGGHSGVRFGEVEGNNYFLYHSDDLYLYAWDYGLLPRDQLLQGQEIWGLDDLSPFQNLIPGYSVLHTNRSSIETSRMTPEDLGSTREQFQQKLDRNFGGYLDYDLRILALRTLSNSSSIQDLYSYCSENPFIDRRHVPLRFLTDEEIALYKVKLGLEVRRRRLVNLNHNLSCFDLFFDELNALYKKKTGLDLQGDEDQDGFENYRDCNLYSPDPEPCEGAFQRPIGIVVSG